MKPYFIHSKTKSGKRFTAAGNYIGNKIEIGYALCGNKDQFCKKIGRDIAEGRAKKKPMDLITYKDEPQPREIINDLRNMAERFAEDN